MRRLFFLAWWSLLGAAGLVAYARYLHPATFSRAIFPSILCLAFISMAFAIANKKYE